MTIEVKSSPDDDAYVVLPSGSVRLLTNVCNALAPVDSYEERRRETVSVLQRAVEREGFPSGEYTLLWPKRWAGLTPQGIDKQGPTWEDAEWLG